MKTKSRAKSPATSDQATAPDNHDGDPIDLEQTRNLLHEVCMLAATASRVSRPRPNLIHDEDDDDREDRIKLLRQTLDRIGWVADVAQRSLGGCGVYGRAEDWMLPGS